MKTFDLVIIGSGIAGISAAETLRKYAPAASICLISNEPHDPYSKVLLPFWLKGKIRFEQLFIRGYHNSSTDGKINSHAAPFAKRLPADLDSADRGQNFWEKNNISFIHGEVCGLGRSERQIFVKLSQDTHKDKDGEQNAMYQRICRSANSLVHGNDETLSLKYSKLLIASGAAARQLDIPGFDLPGVFYLRNLDDATAIKEYYDTLEYHSTENIRPAIYGASFIALEFAGIFAHLGIGAKIFFRGPYFWHRLLDEQGGRLVESFLEASGFEIHKNEEIIKVESREVRRAIQVPRTRSEVEALSAGREAEGGMGQVITTNGEYDCNFLGLGVGLEPNLEFARAAGLKTNQGILTNEYLETSDPDIFAAGDIAEFYDVIIGRHHVLGNWLNSDMQGRTAAINMLGAKKPFELVSSYSFTFDGRALEPEPLSRYVPEAPEVLRAQSTARARNTGRFDICAIGDTNPEKPFDVKLSTDGRSYIKVFIKNSKCVGAILINASRFRAKFVEAIKKKLDPVSLFS